MNMVVGGLTGGVRSSNSYACLYDHSSYAFPTFLNLQLSLCEHDRNG
jgi:hypothetical protein